jgi:steroid 5-alpha reductase family enzyme
MESLKAVTDAWFVPLLQWPHQQQAAAAAAALVNDAAFASVACCLGIIAFCFVASLVTRNYSWTDRLWSLTPLLFALDVARRSQSVRLYAMTALVIMWGARLTYNFARKGGYKRGHEDYRWAVVRSWPVFSKHGALSAVLWQGFNFGFICVYQHVLIWAFSALPMLVVLAFEQQHKATASSLNAIDVVALAAFLGAFALECVADHQQWVFQQSKYGQRAKEPRLAADYRLGFLTHGLFAHTRHANFLGEQLLWTAFSLFGVAAAAAHAGGVSGVAPLGALCLIMLFQQSTDFTESITAAKYPAYSTYQRCVPRLVPCGASASALEALRSSADEKKSE